MKKIVKKKKKRENILHCFMVTIRAELENQTMPMALQLRFFNNCCLFWDI